MFDRLAPFLFVLLWSSSFIAARVGLRHLSPLLFVAIRMVGCAVVLVVLMLVLRRSWRSLSGWNWLHCAVAGALLNAVGLMAPHVGLTIAPASSIALVQSLTPAVTAAAGVLLLRERVVPMQWAGLALGVAGVGLVVGQAVLQSALRVEGMALAFLGVLGLAAGTLYFRRFCRDVPLLPSATAQFLAAAAVSALGAWWLEIPRMDLTEPTVAAIIWNTVIVSLGGMGIYVAMLRHGSAARTAANFYLVPGTVAVMAWVLLREPLSVVAAAGLIVASAGCWLVNVAAPKRVAGAP